MAYSEPTQNVWDSFWSRKQDLERVYPSSPSVLKTLVSRLPVNGLKVLEVGGGSGRDSAELARRGALVTVLDYSPESLKIVQRLRVGLEDRLSLVRGDALRAPFADGSFDLVFHQGLAEHFRDPLPLLRENWRLVRNGGYCLCDVPQTFHLYTVVKHILIAMDRWFAGWETQFTMSQLKRARMDAGFTPVYAYGDWMRPNLLYRIVREIGLKIGLELPKYPLAGSALDRFLERLQDRLADHPWAHWTQLSIGVLGQKGDS